MSVILIRARLMPSVISSKPAASGFSLIEMLVALLVLTVGLLGMAGLQAYSLKNNTSAYTRSQANFLAYDILDAMRSNREKVFDGSQYDIEMAQSALSGVDAQAVKDVNDWLSNLDALLPSGDGAVDCGLVDNEDANCAAANRECLCTVTVQWNDTRDATGSVLQQISLSTLL